jgi:phosphoribosylformylglycinamidine synthase
MKPKALILRSAGANCDVETAYAFERAGATGELVHLNRLLENPAALRDYQLLAIPGGFSYGDDIAAGKIFALLIKDGVQTALRRAVDRGVPIFAPCNGFQILAKMGWLPDLAGFGDEQTITLVDNIDGQFIDRWLEVEFDRNCECVWTQGLDATGQAAMLPIAHGEGRFVASDAVLSAIESGNRVALRYAPHDNVNGSANRIAGICDSTGLVFGLMPHPERFTSWLQHPMRSRLDATTLTGTPTGLAMFQNAVQHARTLSRR